jgi:hypothetical protein
MRECSIEAAPYEVCGEFNELAEWTGETLAEGERTVEFGLWLGMQGEEVPHQVGGGNGIAAGTHARPHVMAALDRV